MEDDSASRSYKERAKAALEQMDDEALVAMVRMMEEMAKKHPRQPTLKIIKPPEE
ncbi:hypothetical protein GTP91_14025 [Rugamonas sp. FT82W]|uniref:Uncharacterized protein n=1 Tax=Duganella vulcania TaxID=2692166 RepID=A0A845G0R7_9BURK|nr:hypothetical protein [Duganella vulcania]MYM88293.1 hypothetical protein [Duganella vulcania]